MISPTKIFCLNEIGQRPNNEDHVSPGKGQATLKDRLFIVCDGVGGEKKGEVASAITCASIQSYMKSTIWESGGEREIIAGAIEYANRKLADYALRDNSAKRMSTTLSLILLCQKSVIAAWCGDTRIHHIRNGKVIWKSNDHSLVSELVRNGEITEYEAQTHPRRNVITRSLNASNTNNLVDFHEIRDIENDDYFLLCTDGLLEQINGQKIFELLHDDRGEDKARAFRSYCEGRTRDNYSMYLVKVKHAYKLWKFRF